MKLFIYNILLIHTKGTIMNYLTKNFFFIMVCAFACTASILPMKRKDENPVENRAAKRPRQAQKPPTKKSAQTAPSTRANPSKKLNSVTPYAARTETLGDAFPHSEEYQMARAASFGYNQQDLLGTADMIPHFTENPIIPSPRSTPQITSTWQSRYQEAVHQQENPQGDTARKRLPTRQQQKDLNKAYENYTFYLANPTAPSRKVTAQITSQGDVIYSAAVQQETPIDTIPVENAFAISNPRKKERPSVETPVHLRRDTPRLPYKTVQETGDFMDFTTQLEKALSSGLVEDIYQEMVKNQTDE
jgi:hypothetical protein